MTVVIRHHTAATEDQSTSCRGKMMTTPSARPMTGPEGCEQCKTECLSYLEWPSAKKKKQPNRKPYYSAGPPR